MPSAGAAAIPPLSLSRSLPLLGSEEVEKFVGFSDGKGGTENNISSALLESHAGLIFSRAWILSAARIAFCLFFRSGRTS
jgi:hypothetical protein